VGECTFLGTIADIDKLYKVFAIFLEEFNKQELLVRSCGKIYNKEYQRAPYGELIFAASRSARAKCEETICGRRMAGAGKVLERRKLWMA